MSRHFARELLAQQAAIVDSPRVAHDAERSFELPRGLYTAVVACYLGFLAVMAAGLG